MQRYVNLYFWICHSRKCKRINEETPSDQGFKRMVEKLTQKKVWITFRSFTWFIFNEIFLAKSNNIYTLYGLINHFANICFSFYVPLTLSFSLSLSLSTLSLLLLVVLQVLSLLLAQIIEYIKHWLKLGNIAYINFQ